VEDERMYRDFAEGEALRALERIAPSRRPWAREPGFHPSAAPHGLPELHVHFLPRSVRTGYRAWERLPSLGVAPAFAAAASQATGLFLDRLPLSPEVIQQCLQSEWGFGATASGCWRRGLWTGG
jgi:hypothetical protein